MHNRSASSHRACIMSNSHPLILISSDMTCEFFQNGPLFPSELRMNSSGAKLNPQICPSNPDLVAYVCNSDIWLSHTLTGVYVSAVLLQMFLYMLLIKVENYSSDSSIYFKNM